MPTELPSGYLYYPTGLSLTDVDADAFSIKVTYRGTYPHRRKGGEPISWYSVESRGSSLSRAGNWAFQIRRFQYQQYRFTLEEARAAALTAVDSVRVMGHTWAEWEARDRAKA